MRVLVLGGTGYVGRRITQRLADRDDEVTVVSRGRLHPEVLDRVKHIEVDRKDRDAFEVAFRGQTYDAVIDNIAYDRDDAESAHRAFKGRIGQYLYTSTMAVYDAKRLDRPVRESDAVLEQVPTAEEPASSSRGLTYTVGKRQVELVFQRASADFPFTALRAPVVVGPDDRTMRIWWFVQRIQDGGPLIFPDWGYGRVFQIVYADDLAHAFVSALGNPVAYNKAYNIAQADIVTPESWVEGFAAALNSTSRSVRIPESLIAPSGLDGYTMPIAGRPFGHFLMDLTAAYKELGFEPTPFREWINGCAQGCAASPPGQSSEGYARRPLEIAVAERFEALQNDFYRRFAEAG